jgi:hypothetical protein
MWKQKDDEEVKQIRQRKKNDYKAIWQPVIFAMFLFLVLAIIMKIGLPTAAYPEFHPVTWKEFFEEELPRAFWFGLIMFIVSYAQQIISKRRIFSGSEVLICLKCNKYKNDDKIHRCDCDGEFVPIDELEWVNE